MLPRGGQNHQWPTSGPSGYIALAVWAVPDASRGNKIRSGPQVGWVATSPMTSEASLMMQSE